MLDCKFSFHQSALLHFSASYGLYVTLIFFRPIIVHICYTASKWAKEHGQIGTAKMIAAVGLGPSKLGMGPYAFLVVMQVGLFKEMFDLLTYGGFDFIDLFFDALGAFFGFSILSLFRTVCFSKLKRA